MEGLFVPVAGVMLAFWSYMLVGVGVRAFEKMAEWESAVIALPTAGILIGLVPLGAVVMFWFAILA